MIDPRLLPLFLSGLLLIVAFVCLFLFWRPRALRRAILAKEEHARFAHPEDALSYPYTAPPPRER